MQDGKLYQYITKLHQVLAQKIQKWKLTYLGAVWHCKPMFLGLFWGVAFKVILKSSLRLVLHLSSEAALDTETSFDV